MQAFRGEISNGFFFMPQQHHYLHTKTGDCLADIRKIITFAPESIQRAQKADVS